jgi:GTP:adenosylcobinamide-phosphate guanylyltransferase
MGNEYEETGDAGDVQVLSMDDMQTGVTAREKGIWQTMFEIAKSSPRDLKDVTDKALSLATMDKESAEECFYALNRGGKFIIGPSIRLAEIMQYTFGRFVTESRVVAIGRTTITVSGSCMDLERMVRVTQEVTRRITTKTGARYNEDMIAVTANAAQSIAIRNAVLRMVPGAIVKKVLRAARKVAQGDAKPLTEQRAQAVESFAKMGVSIERICGILDRLNVEEITLDDLLILRSLWRRIVDDGEPIEIVFPEVGDSAATVAAKDAEDRLRQRTAGATPEPAAKTAEPSKSDPVDTATQPTNTPAQTTGKRTVRI